MDVYLFQWDLAWNDRARNIAEILALAEEAGIAQGSLLALPEMFSTGFVHRPRISGDALALEVEETKSFLAKLAAMTKATVMGGGFCEAASGRFLNRTWVFGPSSSEPLAIYDKLRPFPSERRAFDGGNSFSIFGAGDFKVAPFTCYDLRFPELFREGARLGATAFCVPASWPEKRKAHWEILLAARAIENQAYVFGVNRIGRDPYTSYVGGSRILSPRGEVLAELGDERGVAHAKISLDEVQSFRQELPALRDAGIEPG